jgi:hypothetical protein
VKNLKWVLILLVSLAVFSCSNAVVESNATPSLAQSQRVPHPGPVLSRDAQKLQMENQAIDFTTKTIHQIFRGKGVRANWDPNNNLATITMTSDTNKILQYIVKCVPGEECIVLCRDTDSLR